jgi:ribosomal protein S1
MTVKPTIPETEDEAIKLGLKKLSESEYTAIRKKYHAKELLPTVKCSEKPVGTQCLVLKCLDGYITVVYCSKNRDCTDAYKIPC